MIYITKKSLNKPSSQVESTNQTRDLVHEIEMTL